MVEETDDQGRWSDREGLERKEDDPGRNKD